MNLASTDRQCQRCEDLESPLRLETSSSCGGTCFTINCGLVLLWGKKDLGAPHPWSTDQHCAGCPQGPLAMYWLMNDGGGKALLGPHRGCRHPPNSLQGPAVLQCTPFLEELSQAAPLSVPWPQATPAISNIMEEVTTYHGSAFCSLPSYLPQREGWLPGVALGPFREGFSLFLIPGWVWVPQLPRWVGPFLYQGTTVPTHM